jgi:malate/lactate dehydrogenase
VVIGSGAIGQAVARRVGIVRNVLLADINEDNGRSVAKELEEVARHRVEIR